MSSTERGIIYSELGIWDFGFWIGRGNFATDFTDNTDLGMGIDGGRCIRSAEKNEYERMVDIMGGC